MAIEQFAICVQSPANLEVIAVHRWLPVLVLGNTLGKIMPRVDAGGIH